MIPLTVFSDSDRVIINGRHERREVAAACLAHQPYGFTGKDVERIRSAARVFLAMPLADADALEHLADRIAALLPDPQ